MTYETIRDVLIYRGKEELPLPRTPKIGFGNAIFLLSPSIIDSINILQNPFINFSKYNFRIFYTDIYFNTKIGSKTILYHGKNRIAKDYESNNLNKNIDLVLPNQIQNSLNRERNLIVDTGEWNSFFFKYRFKRKPKDICWDYLNFVANHTNKPEYAKYNKIILVPINNWESVKINKFGLTKENLEDPLSIFIKAFKSFGDDKMISSLFKGFTFIFADINKKEFIKIPVDSLNEDKPAVQLQKILKLSAIAKFEMDEANDATFVKDANDEEIKKACTNNINAKGLTGSKSPTEEPKEGDPDVLDLTTDLDIDDIPNDIDEEPEDDSPIDSPDDMDTSQKYEDEIDAEISAAVSNEVENLPEDIKQDKEVAVKLVEDAVKQEVLMPKFIPEKSKEVQKKIDYLQTKQNSVITNQSISDMKTKIIDKSDYSKMVATKNNNILTSKFANFDKSYNEKKLIPDIDNCVKSLSKASSKVFVTSVDVADTSDQLNLKTTRTYHLEDEEGRKFSIKLDIPTIIEDKYLFLGGNKKIIEKQRILKPIAKTEPNRVQITTFYNKIFVFREGSQSSIATSNAKKCIINNMLKYKVKIGNAKVLNNMYKTPMDFDDIALNILSFKLGDWTFDFRLANLYDTIKDKIGNDLIATDTKVYYGYDKTGKPLFYNPQNEDITFIIINKLKELGVTDKEISSIKAGTNLSHVKVKVNQKLIPIAFLLLFFEGFTEIMKRTDIKYTFIKSEDKEALIKFGYDKLTQGITKVRDGNIFWERYPLRNSLIMNSLNHLDLTEYDFAQLDSKDTYIDLCATIFGSATQSFNLDQFKDFMIDPVTEEICTDLGLPTNITDLLILAVDMLCNNQAVSVNNLLNMRIRGNEIISQLVYSTVTRAYNNYRRTAHKAKPTKIAVIPNQVIKDLLTSPLVEDYSALQPILELEKSHSITFKGPTGINKDRAFGMNKRGFSESMIGVCGISSTPDAGVGILRQLTLEPNITSTRGYIDVTPMSDVDNLSGANLFTPAELLSPPGVMHDDPQRTSMAYKQSKYMLPVANSSPVLIGNKVESIIPYRLSSEFIFVAKDAGEIVEIKNGIVVVKYKNGRYDSFSINPRTQKNSAGGFYIESKFRCDREVGYKFKSGETLGYNDKIFTKNKHDISASMNIGSLVKMAIVPSYDEYEDSAPITKKLSNMLGSEIAVSQSRALPRDAYIDYIVKIGDSVNVGDPLLKFDRRSDDKDLNEIFKNIQSDLQEEIVSNTITTLSAHHSGVISDIKIFAASDIDDYSDSIKKILMAHYNNIKAKNNILKKYSNKDDSNFYKCGQIITETDQKVATYYGKIKNENVGDGILIVFFIKYYDSVKKGDKITNYTALKGIVSHIIDEGYEPFTEYRPDEEIPLLMAPGAVLARKTPSIIHAMFGNKVLIELKRKLRDNYLK